MKRLGLALVMLALVALVPAALSADRAAWSPGDSVSTQYISQSCAQYCRTVCIANGETCAFCGPNCCACN